MKHGVAWVLVAIIAAGCGSNPGATASTSTTWYSMAEKAELTVQCMRDRGINARVTESGIGIEYPTEPAAQLAADECSTEIDARYPDPPPLSMEELYDAVLEGAECLRSLGIDVPSPPTFDAFSEAESVDRWWPWDYIPLQMDFSAVHRQCPQPGLGPTPQGQGG